MNTSLSYVMNVVLLAVVMMIGCISAAAAEEVTLSATFQEPSGQKTGAIVVTVTLAEPAAPPAPPVIDTPQAQVVPEPSTLALVGLGALGLMGFKKTWCSKRSR